MANHTPDRRISSVVVCGVWLVVLDLTSPSIAQEEEFVVCKAEENDQLNKVLIDRPYDLIGLFKSDEELQSFLLEIEMDLGWSLDGVFPTRNVNEKVKFRSCARRARNHDHYDKNKTSQLMDSNVIMEIWSVFRNNSRGTAERGLVHLGFVVVPVRDSYFDHIRTGETDLNGVFEFVHKVESVDEFKDPFLREKDILLVYVAMALSEKQMLNKQYDYARRNACIAEAALDRLLGADRLDSNDLSRLQADRVRNYVGGILTESVKEAGKRGRSVEAVASEAGRDLEKEPCPEFRAKEAGV